MVWLKTLYICKSEGRLQHLEMGQELGTEEMERNKSRVLVLGNYRKLHEAQVDIFFRLVWVDDVEK